MNKKLRSIVGSKPPSTFGTEFYGEQVELSNQRSATGTSGYLNGPMVSRNYLKTSLFLFILHLMTTFFSNIDYKTPSDDSKAVGVWQDLKGSSNKQL